MKAKLTLFCVFLLFANTVFCQTYIKNVTILDVEKGKEIPGQTVIIIGSRITTITSIKNLNTPTDATVIDGTGKFLMPGLVDAHVHFFQSGGLYARPDGMDLQKYMPYEKEREWSHAHMDAFLRRYIRAGITTVIDPGATFSYLKERDSLKDKPYAPNIYMAGPLITTYEPMVYANLKDDEPFNLVTTPEQAVAYVQKQLPYHPDFIKIWYIVAGGNVETNAKKYEPIIKAAIDEAHKNNLRVAVHATEQITAQLAVESGCDYLVHEVEDKVVSDDFIQLLKKHKVVLCPTLIVEDGYTETYGQKPDLNYYDLTQSDPQQIATLFDLKHLPDTGLSNRYKKRITAMSRSYAHTDSVRMINLKKMVDAGITIAAGTDAGNVGTMHATSLFKELTTMQKSGLTNWQVLKSATLGGAKAAGKENEFGSISKDKRADLLLLDADPVENLENLKKINTVINRGRIIKTDTLITETHLSLVQKQINAYNARNVEAFLEPYADDAEIYTFPDKPEGKGKEAMRKLYAAIFAKAPNLHCEIIGRIIQGNTVIDQESISGLGKTKMTGTVIYQFENNKIKRVYIIL
jgi:imidazolonepropionase-like amidohydrolase